jgi:hypothetical protein
MERPLKHRVSKARLRSPLPDLAQGTSAVLRLERSAEELSAGGSDIGEEIKKMVERERERSASRSRSSGQNSFRGDFHPPRIASASASGCSRANSYASSVVDARWGGHGNNTNNPNNPNNLTSPISIGSLASPLGSILSAPSWTQASVAKRAASASKTSRLGHMVEPL